VANGKKDTKGKKEGDKKCKILSSMWLIISKTIDLIRIKIRKEYI
jgi:hypothetical protein